MEKTSHPFFPAFLMEKLAGAIKSRCRVILSFIPNCLKQEVCFLTSGLSRQRNISEVSTARKKKKHGNSGKNTPFLKMWCLFT